VILVGGARRVYSLAQSIIPHSHLGSSTPSSLHYSTAKDPCILRCQFATVQISIFAQFFSVGFVPWAVAQSSQRSAGARDGEKAFPCPGLPHMYREHVDEMGCACGTPTSAVVMRDETVREFADGDMD
jgi:hypothetical protein